MISCLGGCFHAKLEPGCLLARGGVPGTVIAAKSKKGHCWRPFSGVGLPLPIQGTLAEALELGETEVRGNRCGDEQKQIVCLLFKKLLKLV